MVGNATAWYLIRNLYGAPFFKPDLHINAIEKHFFCSGNLNEMSAAVRQLWPKVCTDSRISPVHLGVVDYILWWYREETGDRCGSEGKERPALHEHSCGFVGTSTSALCLQAMRSGIP